MRALRKQKVFAMQISPPPARTGPHASPAAPSVPATETGRGDPPRTSTDFSPFATYDLNAISPREIDRLAKELQDQDFADTKFMMMLLTRGERFQAHLAESVAEATGRAVEPYDPTRPGDLVASTETQLSLARRSGDPTDAIEHFLDMLRTAQAETGHRSAVPAPVARNAETVFQAQVAG